MQYCVQHDNTPIDRPNGLAIRVFRETVGEKWRQDIGSPLYMSVLSSNKIAHRCQHNIALHDESVQSDIDKLRLALSPIM